MNKKQKILFISTSIDLKANSATIRNHSLIKGLVSNNVDVEILTIEWPKEFLSEYFINNRICKVRKTKIPIFKIYNKVHNIKLKKENLVYNKIKEITREILFFPDKCKDWHKLINPKDYKEFDYIITSSDLKSSHYVGLKIKKQLKNIKWIQIWGDPWADDINLNKINYYRALKEEKRLIEKGDCIIYVSKFTKEKISEKFPKLDYKIKYIPRGYYEEIYKSEKTENKNFKITYTGALNDRYSFNLLSAIDEFNKSSSIQVKIYFYGIYNKTIIDKINSYSCAVANDSVDFENIKKIYSDTDGLLLISNKIGSTQIPGKFFDYMGTEIPTICLVDDVDDPITYFYQSHSKCIILENNLDNIKKNMNLIINSIQNKNSICKKYSPENIAKELLSCINYKI